MNGIDIAVGVVLAWAVFAGWRRGAILQLFSLAGIVGGIWLAARYGATVGMEFGFDEKLIRPGGFIVVIVASMLALGLLGQLVRKLFHFAGLGPVDVLLGIAVSLAKWLLLIGVLFNVMQRLDPDHNLISEKSADKSLTYGPICRLTQDILPFFQQFLGTAPAAPASDTTKPEEI